MSFAIAVGAEISVLFAGILLITRFISAFKIKREYFLLFIFPLFIFTLGFSMRLTEIKSMVGLGFFFTDFSFLFVYLLFAIALMLGQLRYWKK